MDTGFIVVGTHRLHGYRCATSAKIFAEETLQRSQSLRSETNPETITTVPQRDAARSPAPGCDADS